MTGSWKGRGNQCIQFVRVMYCKLPTNGKQLPAFPLEVGPGTELPSQRWEARLLPLCHHVPRDHLCSISFKLHQDRSLSPAQISQVQVSIRSCFKKQQHVAGCLFCPKVLKLQDRSHTLNQSLTSYRKAGSCLPLVSNLQYRTSKYTLEMF